MEIEQDLNIHSTECANDVYLFLKENNFLQYWSSFDREGYNDMKQLLDMTPDELEQALAQDIGIKKTGHLKRLKALLAIHSVKGNSNDKEPEDRDANKSSNKTQICRYPSVYLIGLNIVMVHINALYVYLFVVWCQPQLHQGY